SRAPSRVNFQWRVTSVSPGRQAYCQAGTGELPARARLRGGTTHLKLGCPPIERRNSATNSRSNVLLRSRNDEAAAAAAPGRDSRDLHPLPTSTVFHSAFAVGSADA